MKRSASILGIAALFVLMALPGAAQNEEQISSEKAPDGNLWGWLVR